VDTFIRQHGGLKKINIAMIVPWNFSLQNTPEIQIEEMHNLRQRLPVEYKDLSAIPHKEAVRLLVHSREHRLFGAN